MVFNGQTNSVTEHNRGGNEEVKEKEMRENVETRKKGNEIVNKEERKRMRHMIKKHVRNNSCTDISKVLTSAR